MGISRDELLRYMQGNFGLDVASIDDQTELFSTGLLDSFSVADLLTYLEDEGSFVVEPEEVVIENIDTIGNILAFAQRKTASVAG